MESVLCYLAAIERINEADRAMQRLQAALKRGRPPDPHRLDSLRAQMDAAHDAANAAWQAIDPETQHKLQPPPRRAKEDLPESV